MTIDYDHLPSRHSLEAPEVILRFILKEHPSKSILDVGCGQGTWLHAAIKHGVPDVIGVDGGNVDPTLLQFPANQFVRADLTQDWSLGRRFDLAICTEVAEHLDSNYATHLISALTQHSDTIVFSAAGPGQYGQHHVNCQPPSYWQSLFNQHGFVCDDAIRWKLWDEKEVEPWYRQNLFIATPGTEAGSEPRIRHVIHPEMHALTDFGDHLLSFPHHKKQIEEGCLAAAWYVSAPWKAISAKLARRISSRKSGQGA